MRLVCVVAMLAGFSVLSVYVTVSSIYRIGRKDGEQRMRIERLGQPQLLCPKTDKDSINLKRQSDYGCNLQIFLCLFLEKLNMPQNTPVTKAS